MATVDLLHILAMEEATFSNSKPNLKMQIWVMDSDKVFRVRLKVNKLTALSLVLARLDHLKCSHNLRVPLEEFEDLLKAKGRANRVIPVVPE
jgi:hypothetical protein